MCYTENETAQIKHWCKCAKGIKAKKRKARATCTFLHYYLLAYSGQHWHYVLANKARHDRPQQHGGMVVHVSSNGTAMVSLGVGVTVEVFSVGVTLEIP